MLRSAVAALLVSGLIGPVDGSAATVSSPLAMAHGLDLWRGARLGMSVTDLRRLFPESTAPQTPAILTGGETESLEMTGIALAGRPAVARFFFKEARLVAVELTLPDLKAAASSTNLAAAQEIAAEYTAKFGQGFDCGQRGLGDLNAYECTWLKSPLLIRLWYMDSAGQAPLLYVAFRQAGDPGYDL